MNRYNRNNKIKNTKAKNGVDFEYSTNNKDITNNHILSM